MCIRPVVWQVVGWHAWLSRSSTCITLDDASDRHPVDVGVERRARRHVLELLSRWRFVEPGSIGHDLGYLPSRCPCVGPEVWQVGGWHARLDVVSTARIPTDQTSDHHPVDVWVE